MLVLSNVDKALILLGGMILLGDAHGPMNLLGIGLALTGGLLFGLLRIMRRSKRLAEVDEEDDAEPALRSNGTSSNYQGCCASASGMVHLYIMTPFRQSMRGEVTLASTAIRLRRWLAPLRSLRSASSCADE